MPSDASKSKGDSSKSVTAREYREEKSFERTKQSPQGKDLAALSQKA